MAQLKTKTITDLIGSDEFPVNVNDFYTLAEPYAVQNIRALKSANRIENAFFEYPVENGAVICEAVVKMAEKQGFVNTGNPDFSPKDPTLFVKYFNNWESAQWEVSTRKDDVRKVIADKGTGTEELLSIILSTLTEGESYDDYIKMRDILKNAQFGTDAKPLFGNAVAKNAKGILYVLRQCFNILKATNKEGGAAAEYAVPVEDIRIAISEDVLNLIDVTELANVFNLTKEELFGTLVVVPHDPAYNEKSIVVYDRKALGRGTRLYEYSQDVIGKGRYVNSYLTTERCYFVNKLFKALRVDISDAVTTALGDVLVAKP